MASMTIGKRFFVASGTLLVMNALLTVIALYSLSNIGKETDALSTATIPSLVHLSNARSEMGNMRAMMLREMLVSGADIQTVESQVVAARQQVATELRGYEAMITRADEREAASKLQSQIDGVNQNWEKASPSAHTATGLTGPAAFVVYNSEVFPHMSAAVSQFTEIATANKKVTDAAVLDTQHAQSFAWWLTTAVGLASIAVGIGMALFMVRALTQEMGSVVAELAEGASQIAGAAGQVSSSSQSLAQGSSEQAASLQDTSASSEEINSMARKNSDNARQMAGLVGKSQDMFTHTNQQLEEMVVSMDEINESSGKISKIIKVIDEIAFQTNILALNAAVEAARAGEAGMGFAVVADEVRNLAQRSAQAAKDTAMLIEESIAKSNGGKMKVDMVATAIRDITRDSAAVKTLVDEVTLGSEEQSRGLQQISKSIMQMEQVTQTTAATAEESAAAAEELNAQSESLKDIVGSLSALLGDGPMPVVRASRSTAKRGSGKASMGAFGSGKPAKGGSSKSDEGMGAFPLEAAFREF